MNSKTNPRETVYLKLPTYAADLACHFGVFYFLLLCTGLVSGAEKDMLLDSGVALLLAVSYATAVSVCPIRLTERTMLVYKLAARAVYQAILTVLVQVFFISVIYGPVSAKFYIVQGMSAVIMITVCHLVIRYAILMIRKLGRNRLKVVMVGADENIISICAEMQSGYGTKGYDILGLFTDKYSDQVPAGMRILGGMDQVEDYIMKNGIDEIYCAVNPDADSGLVSRIIRAAEMRMIKFWFVPNMNGYPKRRLKSEEFGPVNILCLREEPLSRPEMKLLKRTTDIIVSGLFLITIYPIVWLFAAIGIKLSSPGPVLFRQKRTGYNGEAFECLKFRSMRVNADADKVQATENDPRKTRFGDFLRRTSIDELPQFINVFKGDMSLIGPRPHMELHTEMYSKLISEYMVRHLVKPGLTGWAQINGCRGETRTVEQMEERVKHDIWYIEHWSPMLDVTIFFKTLIQVLFGDDQAY